MSLVNPIPQLKKSKNELVTLTRITYNSRNPHNLTHTFTAPKKLPLQITQDNNRLIINLIDHKNDQTQTKTVSDKRLAEFPSDFVSSKVVAEVVESRQSRLKQMQSSLRAGSKPSSKPTKVKNEHLINILRENCEKNKTLPGDAFITPLLALSNYYKADKEQPTNKKNNSESGKVSFFLR
jgi:hypothetical protein